MAIKKSTFRASSTTTIAILTVLTILTFFKTTEAQTSAPPISALFSNNYSAADRVQKKVFSRALGIFLNIQPGRNTSCYRGLDRNDENSPYICALKRRKIFRSASIFAPNSYVKWDFALTSLCRAQNWTRTKNFSSCKRYATRNGLLSSTTIRSRTETTYGELIYLFEHANTLTPFRGTGTTVSQSATSGSALNNVSNNNNTTTNNSSADSVSAPSLPPLQQPTVTSSPVAEETIASTFFANIALTNSFPNRFYHNEVYFLEGDLTNGITADQVFVFLCRENQSCENSIDYIENTTGNRTHFRIPVYFKETGNFQMGIIPGRSGQSRIVNISVVPQTPEIVGGQAATNLSARYNEGRTTFSWDGNGTLTRLIIFQGQQRRDYVFRQNTSFYSPASEDFANFERGAANWFVKQNSAGSAISSISLTVQDFRRIENGSVQIQNLQEVFSSPSGFTFRARALNPISNRAAITLPNGQVEELIFADDDLPAQRDFTITYNMSSTGTYIFEVNNPEGGALVNVPIYVGGAIPLLPDFITLNPPELDTNPITNLNQYRLSLLNLINENRTEHGLSTVQLNGQLNNIAQGHSEDMVARNFFGHINPSEISPDGRRRNALYNANIRENLARAANLELAEYGLMRSPIHRAVILDPAMKRVGLGITKNTEGYLLITQNFSPDPLTTNDLTNISVNLRNSVNAERNTNGLPPLNQDPALGSLASSWSSRMASEGFFSVADPKGTSLIETARQTGITTSIQINIVEVSNANQLETELLRQSAAEDANNRNIGLGLALNNLGDIFMTVIYTP